MEPLPFQLTNERILYRTKRSHEALLFSLLRGVFFGIIVGAVLATLTAGIIFFVTEDTASVLLLITVIIVPILLMELRLYLLWRATVLTITTNRIFLHAYDVLVEEGRLKKRHRSLFRAATHTIRWDTYQESIYEAGLRERLFNAGTMSIRYGTADASRSITIDHLPYARDLKHYLDKIQSLKAQHLPDSELPAFVPAKRGKRDQAVLTEI